MMFKKYFKKIFFCVRRKSRINKLEYRFEKDIVQDLFYYKKNHFHREKDLPAVIWKDGSKTWYKNGLRHRDNGNPSRIYSDGKMFWYYNGKYIKDNLNEIKNK